MSEIPDIIWDDFEMPHGFSLDEHNIMFGLITEARQTETHAIDKQEAIEILKKLPGIDPVVAVVDGHQEDIPAQGWLVHGKIAPGYGGVVNLFQYLEGSLSIFSFSDTREQYGQATTSLDLNRYGEYVIAYENPNFPQKTVEPYNRMSPASYTSLSFSTTDVIGLENGGRILSQKAPLEIHGGTLSLSITWDDLDKRGERTRKIEVSRAINIESELLQIIAQLAYSMGMDKEGLDKLVSCVKTKIESKTEPQ